MDNINQVLKPYNYLTPELAKKHGISKFKFYKYVSDNDLERTICDLMRSRNSIEIQEFNSVLKAYLSKKIKI